MKLLAIAGGVLFLATGTLAHGEYYSYMNEDSEYVISREPPADQAVEYAVLSERGEFIRNVRPADLARRNRVPIDHWRPWFIPKEPHPLDGAVPDGADSVPTVTIEELDDLGRE